jgi:hypothetical protein
MITVITGLTGSGKTLLMTKLLHKEWQLGADIHVNFPVTFNDTNDGIKRWHNLDELYRLNNGIIGIDEGQKLFDARRWGSLPISFAEKIAQHRKHHLDIYTTTQDIGHIDLRVRSNIHELFNCQSLLRIPRDERKHPILQIVRVVKKRRVITSDNDRLSWVISSKRLMWISRYWTKTLYNTYSDIGFERFVSRIKLDKNKWVAKVYSRELINQGKARL